MELIVKNNTTPIKAIPDIDTILETKFMFWLANLLSLKADQQDKVKAALPAVKKHCWSMGFEEMQKMFTMYVDGELNIKPISNHFDRVLVGQIFQEYRQTKRTEVKQFNESEYKLIQDKLDAISHFDYFLNSNKLDKNSTWVYLFLQDRELIQDNPKTKRWAVQMAIDQKHENPKQFAMRYLLRQYFERLEAKGKHLKDLL